MQRKTMTAATVLPPALLGARPAVRIAQAPTCVLLLALALSATTGCTVPSGAPPGLDLLGLLSPRRKEPKEFCASLDEMAPVTPGMDVRQPAPFVEHRAGPGSRSTSHILWPFISMTRSREERSFALRPAIAFESRPGEQRVVALPVWPAWPLPLNFLYIDYRRQGDNTTLQIVPLFYLKRRSWRSAGRREYDTDWLLLAPPVAGGKDSREGTYFAVFPFFGTLKGQFGKKKMSFFAFPLWLAARDKQYDSFHFMWPTMGYWKGPNHVGRRLFPFFGVNRCEGRFDRRFWLWPFFARWKSGLDTVYPTESFFFFPFYGRVRGTNIRDPANPKPHIDWRTYMWPLFSYRKYGPRNITEAHLPWPVFGYERGDGLVVRKLWPIWGVRKSNDRRDNFLLWPLFRRAVMHEEHCERRWHNVGLVFNSHLERWVEDEKGNRYPPPWPDDFRKIPDPRLEAGTHVPMRTLAGEVRTRRYTQLWPLFHYSRNDRSEVSFQMLSVLTHPSGGRAEALYGPFFSLYRYQRDRTGQKRESLLLGLIRHFRRPADPGPGMRYVNIAGIVSYHRRAGVGKKFSILGGLIGYERIGERWSLRFLWTPFGRIPRAVREEYESRYAAELESR